MLDTLCTCPRLNVCRVQVHFCACVGVYVPGIRRMVCVRKYIRVCMHVCVIQLFSHSESHLGPELVPDARSQPVLASNNEPLRGKIQSKIENHMYLTHLTFLNIESHQRRSLLQRSTGTVISAVAETKGEESEEADLGCRLSPPGLEGLVSESEVAGGMPWYSTWLWRILDVASRRQVLEGLVSESEVAGGMPWYATPWLCRGVLRQVYILRHRGPVHPRRGMSLDHSRGLRP